MKMVHLADVPETGVSHDPTIKKKTLIGRNEIPNLMMFSRATFKPGQSVEPHSHETMFEVYYVCSGKAVFIINGEEIEVAPGDCITVEPRDEHSVHNPFDSDAAWLYFGVTT